MSKKKDAANFTYKSGKTEITGSTNDQNLMKLVNRDHWFKWVSHLLIIIAAIIALFIYKDTLIGLGIPGIQALKALYKTIFARTG